MGFQSNINNLLTQAAIGGRALKFAAKEATAAKDSEAAAKEAEQKELELAKEAEQKQIAETETKIDEAIKMSLGYNQGEIRKQAASKELGINIPQKNPRGVSQKVFERRQANAMAMKEILTKYSQEKDWRDRLAKFSTKDLSGVLNPSIRGKKGGIK